MSDDFTARDGRILVNRYRKARKIADILCRIDVTIDQLKEGYSDALATRTLAGQIANVNTPSAVTWHLVLELIAERRAP